jgi:hypothetical protein
MLQLGCVRLTTMWTYIPGSSSRINIASGSLIRQPCTRPRPQSVRRAPNTSPSPVQDMSIDHRRRHIPVSQQLLHRPDIVPGLKQMGRKGVPQRMAARSLSNPTRPNCLGHGSLNDRLMQMMPLNAARLRIPISAPSREDPLPWP